MTWNDKKQMTQMLNAEDYAGAVEMLRKEKEWDTQAVEMFINGFDLSRCELLEPIRERILSVRASDIRTALRLSIIFSNLILA